MTFVELVEVFRNLGLFVLAVFGVSFAAKQLKRATDRDAMDTYCKALEQITSENYGQRRSGYLLMGKLRHNPKTKIFAEDAISTYIETASEEERKAIKAIDAFRT